MNQNLNGKHSTDSGDSSGPNDKKINFKFL